MDDYILVVDSGIGGLSILTECLKVFRGRYIYLSLSKSLPLGNKSKKQIYNIVKSEIEKLLKIYDIKIVVIACNTITTSAIDLLRERFLEISFIGTEPCIKYAKDNAFNKVLVVCTNATKKNSNVIKKYKTKSDYIVGDKSLAKLIEENRNNLFRLYGYVLYKFRKYKNKIGCVVLGCTHYSFIKNIFEDVLKVPCFDSAKFVANRLENVAKMCNINQNYSLIFCDTNNNQEIFRYFCQNSLIYQAKYVNI